MPKILVAAHLGFVIGAVALVETNKCGYADAAGTAWLIFATFPSSLIAACIGLYFDGAGFLRHAGESIVRPAFRAMNPGHDSAGFALASIAAGSSHWRGAGVLLAKACGFFPA